MSRFPQYRRPPQNLAAGGIVGAADPLDWAALPATPLDWDALFASTGLFGVEIGAEAAGLAGTVVALRGFMSPPMDPAAAFFVLSRTPLPNCPFCAPSASWPDDIVVVHLRALGMDVDHPLREVLVRGRLVVGEADGPMAGLRSHAQLQAALWQPASLNYP